VVEGGQQWQQCRSSNELPVADREQSGIPAPAIIGYKQTKAAIGTPKLM
jgi:hypothetical protein